MPEQFDTALCRTLADGPFVTASEFVCRGRLGGPWQSNEHCHEQIQITMLTASNSARIEWMSESGSKKQKSSTGPSICVTPANQPHSMMWNEVEGAIVLLVSPGLLGGDGNCTSNAGLEAHERYCTSDPFLLHLGEMLRYRQEAGRPIPRLVAEAIAVTFLEHSNDSTAVQQGTHAIRTEFRLLLEYIEANLETELSVAQLARVSNMSPFHFLRRFKTAIGRTPHQYVMDRRVERAKKLLADVDHAIASIAQACGFATQAHLATVFGRAVGVTPSTYRAQVNSRKAIFGKRNTGI